MLVFCETYYKKHVDGKRHNNMVKFIEKVKNKVLRYTVYI